MAIFAGPAAKTANLGALAKAKEMAAAGSPRNDIWNETGWFQGPDKNWRFEIPDKNARFDFDALPELNKGQPAGDLVPLDQALYHPALFDAYPELQSSWIRRQSELGGRLNPIDKEISIGPNIPGDLQTTPLASTLHEVQHLIQDKEGFSLGSGMHDPFPKDMN
jgi:hypothetical protein